jgi:peroxiredoxin
MAIVGAGSRWVPHAVPWVLVAVLAASNVMLLRKNSALRGGLRGSARGSEAKQLKRGDVLQSFQLIGLDGSRASLSFPTDRTLVLLYFSPTCLYCWQQAPQWRSLVEHIDSKRYRIQSIVPEGPRAEDVRYMVSTTGLRSVPIGFAPKGVQKQLRVFSTPTTIVVSEDGRVLRVWTGRWGDKDAADAASYFGVPLSGIGPT